MTTYNPTQETTERAKVLREAAIVVAQSKQVPVSLGYAIARELWSLWWEEMRQNALPQLPL